MQTPTKSLGFPAHIYTDARHFDYELQTIWRDTWQLVGRANALAEPGDYLTCTLGKEPIFVARATDGSLQARHNLCPHRGARLLAGEGNCPTHKITCPYHAWTFELEGNLLGVANAKLFPNLDKAQCQLTPARVETWGGFVFVNANPTGELLAEYLAEMPAFLELYDQDWTTLHEVDRWHYDQPINWKFVVENYVEDYHFKAVHGSGFGTVYDIDHIRSLPTGRHLRIEVPYTNKQAGEFFTSFTQSGKASYQGYIFPNIMLNPHKKFTSMFHLIPLDAELTRIEIIIYQSPAQFKEIPYRSSVFRQGFDTFMEEDFAICRQLQASVHSRAYRVTQLAEEHEVEVGHFYNVLAEYQR
jgi:phenylpropionate dioxygenase-like ring-hydroxylating dioxygenase large terminal subunit